MKSIVTNRMDRCFYCGATHNIEEHHIIYGLGLRDLSEKYGLKVGLCPICHRDGKRGVHGCNKKLDHLLKKKAQKAFMKHYPDLDFMSIFHRNYLDEQ